jgi:hypothetical protein
MEDAVLTVIGKTALGLPTTLAVPPPAPLPAREPVLR